MSKIEITQEDLYSIIDILEDSISHAGFYMSGTTDSRAEDSQPIWVCNTRILYSKMIEIKKAHSTTAQKKEIKQ